MHVCIEVWANALQPSIQAETEELARTVESLIAENEAVKSELDRLTDNSEKVRLENAMLMVHPYANSIIPYCI